MPSAPDDSTAPPVLVGETDAALDQLLSDELVAGISGWTWSDRPGSA